MPFCPACGTQNEGASCQSCGTIIPSLSPQRAPQARVPTAAVGTVAAIVVAVTWALARMSASQTYQTATADSAARMTAVQQSYSHMMDDIESGGTHCVPSDFKVSGLRGTEEYGYITILGVVKNNCNEAVGPQLKISIYNKKGEMLDTQEPWPASISNIGAHQSYEFKTMMPAQEGWETYRVGVLTVKRW